jgi:hypothetical protein
MADTEVERLLAELVAELDAREVLGIFLGGSYARGAPTLYSDVDLAPVLPDDATLPPKRYEYRAGRLISISPKALAGWRTQMTQPERAIYAVPSVRECRILLDKDGSLARLQQEAFAFRWEPLQPAADAFADDVLQHMPEYVHKILGGIATRDESMMAYAVGNLARFVTGAVATQRGVLVVSQNTLYRQLWEELGLESAWTRAHAAAVGSAPVEHTPVLAPSTLIERAFAALRLYIETIRLLRPILLPGTRQVADECIRIIQQAHPGLEQLS